jgi:uncharacterized protein YqeY
MILENIDQDLKGAMKEKNDTALSALRNLKAALKNAEIEKAAPLDEVESLKVIAKKVKQHKDSIESFLSGGRQDLVDVEIAQMKVLEKYLPQQMDEAQVRALVQAAIKDLSATPADFGKVMKEVIARAKGQTDGTVVSKIVKEELK